MTNTPITSPSSDDIVLDDDDLTQRLDREADAILAGGERRTFGETASIRQAVREDVGLVREKISGRVHRVQEDIQDSPMKATLYALGIGVMIGMILRR